MKKLQHFFQLFFVMAVLNTLYFYWPQYTPSDNLMKSDKNISKEQLSAHISLAMRKNLSAGPQDGYGPSMVATLVEPQYTPSDNLTKSDKNISKEQLLAHISLAMRKNLSAEPQDGYGPSMVATLVEDIIHIPRKHQIEIHLKEDRQNCSSPVFFGRLSGPYVVPIQWNSINESGDDDDDGGILGPLPLPMRKVITGHYNVPSSGKYFIEIISLMCEELSFHTNYRNICLENPTNHRITNDTAFINVTMVSKEKKNDNSLGYWKWALPNVTHHSLLTRYQPLSCRGNEDKGTSQEICNATMSLDRFSTYELVYNENENNSSKYTEVNIQSTAEKVVRSRSERVVLCFIGDSHQNRMVSEVNTYLRKWNLTHGIEAKHFEAQYPEDIYNSSSSGNKNNFLQYPGGIRYSPISKNQCNSSVVALAQWPLAFWATSFPLYEEEVKKMIQHLQDNNMTNLHLRQIHYNPLGDVKVACPPVDWRSPPVIDQYNKVIQKITSSKNISYIDTNFIIKPMWDSARDWCHYEGDQIAAAEALYMIQQLLLIDYTDS